MLPHQPGHCCSALWGFAGTLPTDAAMGSGVTPAAAFAQKSPAAWRQARLALAIEALALGCSGGGWGAGGAGVRHQSTTVQP